MKNTYLEIIIGNEKVDPKSIVDLPLSIHYKLEDKTDFTSKQGSDALSISFPATTQNDKVSNTYHNPAIEDLTIGQVYRSIRDARIKVAGVELLVGKAFLKEAKHNGIPLSYEYDFYGNNSDWIISLKETTMYDFLKQISFIFTKSLIISSWNFDGTDENLPYCFIPIRYGISMETALSIADGTTMIDDYNMRPDYMKPSISKYWLIIWGFRSIGYTVKSDFFDTEYFRRQMMPWTWGNFLDSDGTKLDTLKFLAKSTNEIWIDTETNEEFVDVKASNVTVNGAFDNSKGYSYIGSNEMQWIYPSDPTMNFGTLNLTVHLNIFLEATAVTGSYVVLKVYWYKNGILDSTVELLNLTAPTIGRRDANGNYEDYHTFDAIVPTDRISARIWLDLHDSDFGRGNIRFSVESFETAYFRTPIGGTVNFENFLGLKNFKFLDFLAGVIDEFDIVPQADSATKTIFMEPSHPYSTTDDLSVTDGGYFNGNWIDWSDKQDLAKESTMENFTDSERELYFMYKDDPNDGALKKIQDRNNNRLGQAKYVFPDRFKAGTKNIENRFFAPTMHYDVLQWKFDGLDAPQMIIMAPENVSNLSHGEAQNTFAPKSIYYKGLTTSYKWVFDNDNTQPYPFGFAVNYKTGGEVDPIFSYADEQIGIPGAQVTGKGLLRRFYLQRLAIMRNGQYYTTFFRLNNNDVCNFLHREFIICRGQKWELIELTYKPLRDDSAEVILRKWSPVTVIP